MSNDGFEQVSGTKTALLGEKPGLSTLFFPHSRPTTLYRGTTHEVHDVKDKREVIREALRVIKTGGHFAFQDLFLVKGLYGEVDDLLKTVEGWGIAEVAFVDTSASDFIPAALKLPFMVGKISIIYGTK